MSIDTNAIAKMGVKGESSWLISDMRQINLFIGPNNSGKSRFIRSMFLYYSKGFCFDLRNVSIKEISEHVKKKIFVNNHSMPLRSLDVSVSGKLEQSITIEGSKVHDLSSFISAIYRASTRNGNTSITAENNFDQVIKRSYLDDIVDGETIKFIENLKQVDWRLVYIPTLRTLRSVAESDVFHKRTTSDYFKDLKDKNASIFTGHELYKDLVRHLLGTHEKRLKVRSYETYLSEHFFFGKEISLVPMVDQDVVYLKEAEKPDRPIYDLGDGIQSIILVTYKVFMAEQPTMFFIEEPEHHLHAGLQRTLIETIAKNKEHLFFITTHSNHFLDLAQERDDVSVQKIWKNGDETLVEPVEKFTMLLTELGVRASSVLLANCSIWVEGVTDKLYLRTYLKKYIDELQEKDPQQAQRLKSYHENLHFVFAEYQGSNITHWDFNDDVIRSEDKTQAKCFSRNIFLVADADIKK
ncbi:ATP-binding protein [uncultured Rheinheimera sp.]|uniref:AAA family ATPase n=1 Tax=uncultured Rheinheimera sp. TaxID=400532 RepID=UPI002598C7B4|nr:ATP-binding protein [uncultured Rheinheimera sp.]